MGDSEQERSRRAVADHLVGDDLARLTVALQQIRGWNSASDSERRQVDAALTIAHRAARTLERLGSGDGPRREPTRLARVIERIVSSHDPEQRRLRTEVTAAVVNVDEVRLERIIDRLVVLAIGSAAPGTTVSLRGGPEDGALRFTVRYVGREAATGLEQALADRAAVGDWPTLLRLVDDLQGEVVVGDDGTGITVGLPRLERTA